MSGAEVDAAASGEAAPVGGSDCASITVNGAVGGVALGENDRSRQEDGDHAGHQRNSRRGLHAWTRI